MSDFRPTPVFPSVLSLLTLGQAIPATAKFSFIYTAEKLRTQFEQMINLLHNHDSFLTLNGTAGGMEKLH